MGECVERSSEGRLKAFYGRLKRRLKGAHLPSAGSESGVCSGPVLRYLDRLDFGPIVSMWIFLRLSSLPIASLKARLSIPFAPGSSLKTVGA